MNDAYFMQLMEYLAADVASLGRQYRELQQSKDSARSKIYNKSQAAVVASEIEEMQQSLADRQHKAFIQWYDMNQQRIAEGKDHYTGHKVKELGYCIVRGNYKDLLRDRHKNK